MNIAISLTVMPTAGLIQHPATQLPIPPLTLMGHLAWVYSADVKDFKLGWLFIGLPRILSENTTDRPTAARD